MDKLLQPQSRNGINFVQSQRKLRGFAVGQPLGHVREYPVLAVIAHADHEREAEFGAVGGVVGVERGKLGLG